MMCNEAFVAYLKKNCRSMFLELLKKVA